jgi:hypothetical protein
LLDYNAENDQLAIWELPAPSWRELEVTENELHPIQAAEPTWEGRNYDPDTNEVEGTWRGSATDLELVESREQINEIRNDLEAMAKEGLTIRVKQSSIVRGAVREICMAFIADFEAETLYSGEELEGRIDEAIDHWDLDENQQEQEQVDDTKDDQSETEPNIENFGSVVDTTTNGRER